MYISIDIEATGPIPGPHSMIQLGATAFTKRDILGEVFQVELEELPNSDFDPATRIWWIKQGDALPKIQESALPIEEALEKFTHWLRLVTAFDSSPPTIVAYPASFDWMFLYWYIKKYRFDNKLRFGMSALDIKTFASAKLNIPFRSCVKRNMPKELFKDLPKHTHEAGQDSLEQAVLFQRLLNV